MKNQPTNFRFAFVGAMLLSMLFQAPVNGLGPFTSLFNQEWNAEYTFTRQVEKHIADLQKRKIEAQAQQALIKTTHDVLQKKIASLKERVQRVRGTEYEYVTQELAIANKTAQVLNDINQVYQDLKSSLDAHTKLLQEYKADPEFKNKGFQAEQKSIYSIDDFQKINSIVLKYEAELRGLEERLKKVTADFDTLKKNQALARQEYEDKRREQKELKAKDVVEERPEQRKMTLKQRGELLDAEECLLGYKKDLADLKVKEADQRAQYIEQSIKIARLQLETLESEAEHVRKELRVDKKDLIAAQTALKNQVAESNRLQEEFAKRIESLNLFKQTELNQISQARQRYRISDKDLEAIYNWSYQPATIMDWNALIDTGRLHDHIMFETDIHKEILQSRIEQEKAKVAEAEIQNQIIQSWYNVTAGTYDGYQTGELAKEVKQYEKTKADMQASIASLADKLTAASNMLNANARVAEALKARMRAFKEQRETLFKSQPEEFMRLGNALKDAINDAQQRGEVIAQLIELDHSLVNAKETAIKKIDGMLSVLNMKSQWQGGPQLWKGLKKFVPDMTRFVQYLFDSKHINQSITQNQKTISAWIASFRSKPSLLLTLALYLLILFLVYLLLRLYLPELALFFSRAVRPEYKILYAFSNLLATLVTFVVGHLKGMYLWLLAFLAVRMQVFDGYFEVIFYLLSIPLSIYYIHRFIVYLKAVNSARGYLFTSQRYQQRFFLVISIFFYATATIFFLRQAILRAFPKADAPHTLLALNFILLQVSLILIIAREQVLSLIPRSTPLWEWVYEHLNKYYYFFLAGIIFVIVMSNPYIGYGPTFFYAITRLMLIALLIPFFTAVHNKIKQWSGSFFFYSDEEGIKERFRYGRTSYGLFVIASFLFLTILAILVAINVWGYQVGIDTLLTWLRKGIYGYTHPSTGRHVDVNAVHLIQVFFYIIGGILFAYFVNKFVLKRMFDLLLVNAGIQSAVLSLTRYIIIITAIVIALSSIGLNYSLLYIFAVLGGLGVAGKEIITDFIGYFVILIQRPIKIGDYIKFDAEHVGVVRHLTLRSIVMRRQNSVTIIIPNSYALTKPVINWNYSRTYFAFDDIFIPIVYAADPALVKEIILTVLDSNVNILKNPAPIVRLFDFTDNGFMFQVRGYLSPDKVQDQYDIASDVRLELVRVLRGRGLDVGSPTRVLKIVQEKPRQTEVQEEIPIE